LSPAGAKRQRPRSLLDAEHAGDGPAGAREDDHETVSGLVDLQASGRQNERVPRGTSWAVAAALVAAGLVPALARSEAAGHLVPGDGRAVRSLSGTDPVTGKRVSLKRWSGKPVVVNVWGSWCRPCNKEAPELARFSARHRGVVVGLNVEDSKPGARAFYRKYWLRYPSIFDPRSKLFRSLGGTGVPTTLFLDRRHRIVAAILGAGTLEQLEKGLSRASR
jgi:thiol-disulfide isomerase/thioredoxin